MCSVPGFLPISECLPIEIGRLIALDFDTASAGLKPGLAPEFHGAADLERLPLPMLRNADHVADHLRCGQTRDQTIFGDVEGEILAALVGIEALPAAWTIFSNLIGHHIIFATDTIGERVVIDRRGG